MFALRQCSVVSTPAWPRKRPKKTEVSVFRLRRRRTAVVLFVSSVVNMVSLGAGREHAGVQLNRYRPAGGRIRAKVDRLLLPTGSINRGREPCLNTFWSRPVVASSCWSTSPRDGRCWYGRLRNCRCTACKPPCPLFHGKGVRRRRTFQPHVHAELFVMAGRKDPRMW